MVVALNCIPLSFPFAKLFTFKRLKRTQLSGWFECTALVWWWFNLSDYPECTQLRCANGACYNRTQRCDHILDCRDGSDEANCSKKPDNFSDKGFKWKSLLNLPKCKQKGNTIHSMTLSPNRFFFLPFSVVFSLAQHCNTGLFPCHNGVCVPQRYVCDHDDDCGDRSDELNCSM